MFKTTKIDHVAVNTNDMEATLRFYFTDNVGITEHCGSSPAIVCANIVCEIKPSTK